MNSSSDISKKRIVDSYVFIINDFFSTVAKSNSDLSALNICIGINTINRVFEHTLLRTKCIETAKYYSQKSYYYYLEYMEQVSNMYLSQGLNHMDAVMFVYKKTIFDLANDDTNQSVNMITMQSSPLVVNDVELNDTLGKIFKLINTLFYWDNKNIGFSNRLAICHSYLSKFLKKLDIIETLCIYLEMLQYKISMDFLTYESLLTELADKKIRKKDDSINDWSEFILIKFYIDESTLIEKFESGNMKDFVKWLCAPI
jgi:hypothetical protein